MFVIGGATYSEIRSVYELAQVYKRDVFIGTTEILRPSAFVNQLSQLKSPVPLPTSVIAPYVPPYIPPERPVERPIERPIERIVERPVEVSLSHMNINSPQLSTKTSSLSLSSLEKTPEEKKKKKGLKRLFG